MAKRRKPEHFVVDGSNIATEGRSQPSLEQLNEAVLAFMDDHSDVLITVVVDATFGHRIAKKEVKAFDEAVANNELVTPPAGAVGRGDAFVLQIANKAKAGILSNDSFQEFHGEYEWLFDEGRLIGGKPVPHVGWVFVTRTPVRGPKSRQSVRASKESDRTDAKERANRRVRARPKAEPAADAPATEPAAPDSKRESTAASTTQTTTAPSAPTSKEHVNELMPFLDFVEHHPVGTSCTGVVESYSSHGAYARVGEVLIYVPLRLMDDPPPRSARSALELGEAVTVVVSGFVPDRRSIDAALPHMASVIAPDASAADAVATEDQPPAKRARAKKTPAKKTPAKKTAAKRTAAKRTPAKKTTAKKTTAKKTPAKKTTAKKTTAKKTPAKKAPAKKAPAKKTAAKKTPAKKAGAARKRAVKKAASTARTDQARS